MFSSHQTKLTAEKLGGHILEAFETVLRSPVTIEIRCETKKDSGSGVHVPLILPPSMDGSSQIRDRNGVSTQAQILQPDILGMGRSEIVEVAASPREPMGNEHVDNLSVSDKTGLGGSQVGEATASSKKSTMASLPEKRKLGGTKSEPEPCQKQGVPCTCNSAGRRMYTAKWMVKTQSGFYC